MPIVITRKDLYERVWAEPIQKLSKEYGLSDVGLAKVCRRYDIPIPPRGHWAKKQAGKRVAQPPLPPQGAHGYGDQIRLAGPSELSARTFCTFRRELSSLRRTVSRRRAARHVLE